MSGLTAFANAAMLAGGVPALQSAAGGAFRVALYRSGAEITDDGYSRQTLRGVGDLAEEQTGAAAILPLTEMATFTPGVGVEFTFDEMRLYGVDDLRLLATWPALGPDGAALMIPDAEGDNTVRVRFRVPKKERLDADDFKIDSTGSDPAGGPINQYLAHAEDNGKLAQLECGSHLVDEKLILPNATTLAGRGELATELVVAEGFSDTAVIESSDYATTDGTWRSDGVPCSSGVASFLIDGSQITTPPNENTAILAADTRDASDLYAIRTKSPGQAVRNVKVYKFPGTAIYINRAASNRVGAFQKEDREDATGEGVVVAGALAGVHIAGSADGQWTGGTIYNVRDWGFRLGGSAWQIFGATHIYGMEADDETDGTGVAFLIEGDGNRFKGVPQADSIRVGFRITGAGNVFDDLWAKRIVGYTAASETTPGVGVEISGQSNVIDGGKIETIDTDGAGLSILPGAHLCRVSGLRIDHSAGALTKGANVVCVGLGYNVISTKILDTLVTVGGGTYTGPGAQQNDKKADDCIAYRIGATGQAGPYKCVIDVRGEAFNSPARSVGLDIRSLGYGNEILFTHDGNYTTPVATNGVSLSGSRVAHKNLATGTLTVLNDWMTV